ncbi:MAG: hypothetical protein LBD30_05810 [Verrucomicrobiales bacterium]|jgi:hypothetical protein|nr:hypothetical protein [Verrucomicrobiales bacterium]
MAGERQGRRALTVLLFVAVTVGGAVWAYRFERGGRGDLFGNKISRADYLRVQAENVLLKKMLGQVAGRVVVLGAASEKSGEAAGRLVWYKAVQGGSLLARNLPDAGALYSLWIGNEGGKLYYCGVFAANADGEAQGAFQCDEPVLKPRIFFVARGTGEKVVVLRGNL